MPGFDGPILAGSRLRLLVFWVPILAFCIIIVALNSVLLLSVPKEAVMQHNPLIWRVGLAFMIYFITTVLKDLCIMLYFTIWGNPDKSLFNACYSHAITIPFDVLVALSLGTWGVLIFDMQESTQFMKSDLC